MKLPALSAAILGARNVSCEDAFISAAISSSAASNAFVARQSSFTSTASFGLENTHSQRPRSYHTRRRHKTAKHGTSMLLDFIKKRAQEGIEQTKNLVSAAQEGWFDEALKDVPAYAKDSRRRQG